MHCDHCAACKRGDTQMCLEVSSLIGWNRPGGYAEYVPVPENCLLPVPDDIEDSLAPLLLDVIGTSGHAVRFVSRVVSPNEAGPVLVAESRRSVAARRRHEGAPGHQPACLRLPEPLVAGRSGPASTGLPPR